MAIIHPSAIVSPKAQLAENVEIGAYSIVGEDVCIDEGTIIESHVVIKGRTQIGKNNHIYQFCSLGEIPQDKKYAGEPTQLVIGNNNTIREFCTFNLGTVQDRGVTRLGDDNWIMGYVHIAHDCQVGSHTIFANNAQLAGHVLVEDWVVFGGYTGVHQFCHVGAHVMTAAYSLIVQDVPPFVLVAGNTAKPFGLNVEGIKRRGFTSDQLSSLKTAYRYLYRMGLRLDEAKEELSELAKKEPEVKRFVDFIEHSHRGLVR